MDEHFEMYQEMAKLLEFSDADAANLVALAPVFEKHGEHITNHFYESLLAYPKTAAIIEGRVETLKGTHRRWMKELFAGEYGESFFNTHYRIGQVHVTHNINPEYVSAVTSVLRTYGRIAIFEELGNTEEAAQKADSLAKVLELGLLVINLAYADERVERITKVTGMSRKLIENLIKRGGKKK